MLSALTPELSKHSQVAHFYNKLMQTDPNARDRAAMNHAVAAMVKKRQEDEENKRHEGQTTNNPALLSDASSCLDVSSLNSLHSKHT